MAPRKDPEKVPEIPYSGALKKLLEPILDANFPCSDSDVNGGKKYWIHRKVPTPRQWYIELHRLPRDCGFAFRVVINAALPPATEPAFATISSVVVSDVKVNGDNIIIWVENSSGSVANVIFNEGEDKFQARLYTDALATHDEALKEVREEPLLDSQGIRDLNGNSRKIAKVLKSVLKDITSANVLYAARASKEDGSRSRKRISTTAAPSRDLANKGKGKVQESSLEDTIPAGAAFARGGSPQNVAVEFSVESEQVMPPQPEVQSASGQLPNGGSDVGIEKIVADTTVAKRRRRVNISAKTQRGDRDQIATEVQSPETRRVLEEEFRAACTPVQVQASPTPKRNRRGGVLQHPRKTADGRDIDVEDRTLELKQFKERTKPIFPFGPAFRRQILVDSMVVAPPEFKYRPFHDSLVKTLLEIMLTSIHPHKQTLTLMPITDVKPTSFDDVKNGMFYIINGQHSWAAAKQLIENPLVSDEEKEKWKQWRCDFVWTEDLVLLSDFSRRANNENQHQWNSPEYLLHIQYARDLWIKYGRPQAKAGVKLSTTERKNWKDFQLKAAETLNSMLEKNAAKSSNDYQGEFKVICADDDLFNATMKAFTWYENGELLNPDTGNKWKDEAAVENKEWSRKYTVAYTFKCVRSLGRESLLELVEKITAGLNDKGDYLPEQGLPKVFLGGNKPKSKKVSTLKEWTDRKKAKNAVVRWLSRRTEKELWGGEDVNSTEWKEFKEEVGFTSAHMDELIRRATRGYLSKFMKVSDNPKREQVPPSDAFLSEMQRILYSHPTVDHAVAPVLAWYKNDGELSQYGRERLTSEEDVPGMEGGFDKDWVGVQASKFSFLGGIMDLRVVDKFMQDDDVVPRLPDASPYMSFLSNFGDRLRTPSYWMVIAHSNKSEEVVEFFKRFFPSWHASESRYVPAAGEKFFFSSSTLKVGNGVVIYKLAKDGVPPLTCKRQVASDESERRFGEVREYGLYDHELRMEIYLNFLSENSTLGMYLNVAKDILCITAGRKPMIAAVMSNLRPVAVVVYNKPSRAEYLQAHKLGCKLQNFAHLFDSSVKTNDEVQSDWLGIAPEPSESEDESVRQELRMKRREDKRDVLFNEADELNEHSDDASNTSSDEGEFSGDCGIEHQTEVEGGGGVSSTCPGGISTPASPSSLAKLRTLSLAMSSPAAHIYKNSTFSSFSLDLEQLLSNKEVAGTAEPTSSFLRDCSFDVPAASTDDCIEDVRMELTPPVVNCPPEPVSLVVEVQEECIGDAVAAVQSAVGEDMHGPVDLQVLPKEEPMDDRTPHPMESNKDDPIIIDSDEEDHILSSVRNDNPSDGESDLSDLPAEEPADSGETKLSQQRALRIQLKAISKKKLSVNRANLRKNRELEFQNRKLLLELAKERELLQQAHEQLRSCAIANVVPIMSDGPSPSVGRSHQAMTSIASAPKVSFSEVQPEVQVPAHRSQNVGEDCIPGTQESTLARKNVNRVHNANLMKRRFQSFEEGLTCRRNKKYLYIFDSESVSPNYSEFTKLRKPRLVRRFQVEPDDDEVMSVLRES